MDKSANNFNSLGSDRSSNNSNNSTTVMSPGVPLFNGDRIDKEKCRFPHSIVWTPIPLLTWLFPIIGHMGICTTQGIIRDFAGPYFVSVCFMLLFIQEICYWEDNMAFGNPTKYWQLDLSKLLATNGRESWDRSVYDASEEYKGRMHNLCCDNCHSHVAYALNAMRYDGSTSWNMIKLCFLMLCHGKYVSFAGFLKTWLPFLVIIIIAVVVTAVVMAM